MKRFPVLRDWREALEEALEKHRATPFEERAPALREVAVADWLHGNTRGKWALVGSGDAAARAYFELATDAAAFRASFGAEDGVERDDTRFGREPAT